MTTRSPRGRGRELTVPIMTDHQILRISRVVLRVALGITFLVAIADRFGLLGPYGSKNVSWGDWKHFEQNVAILNWFIPKTLIPALAAVETALEAALGVALWRGYIRESSLGALPRS
jgi:putative oxidoreductase